MAKSTKQSFLKKTNSSLSKPSKQPTPPSTGMKNHRKTYYGVLEHLDSMSIHFSRKSRFVSWEKFQKPRSKTLTVSSYKVLAQLKRLNSLSAHFSRKPRLSWKINRKPRSGTLTVLSPQKEKALAGKDRKKGCPQPSPQSSCWCCMALSDMEIPGPIPDFVSCDNINEDLILGFFDKLPDNIGVCECCGK